MEREREKEKGKERKKRRKGGKEHIPLPAQSCGLLTHNLCPSDTVSSGEGVLFCGFPINLTDFRINLRTVLLNTFESKGETYGD